MGGAELFPHSQHLPPTALQRASHLTGENAGQAAWRGVSSPVRQAGKCGQPAQLSAPENQAQSAPQPALDSPASTGAHAFHLFLLTSTQINANKISAVNGTNTHIFTTQITSSLY